MAGSMSPISGSGFFKLLVSNQASTNKLASLVDAIAKTMLNYVQGLNRCNCFKMTPFVLSM